VLTGTVNARNELVIGLPVQDGAGQAHHMEAILDTGFTGSLTLPSSLVARLDLRWRSRGDAILPNGNVEEFDVYAATVIWDGVPRAILVQAIDNAPLLGMALLARHDLRCRVIAGGTVEIEPVP